MSSTGNTSISSPQVALTHDLRTSAAIQPLDPMDPIFGYTLSSSRTHESRHDRDSTAFGNMEGDSALPAYTEESGLPEYTLHAPEPVTLAMYLFKFGFLFPFFWIFGAFILFSPLREPPCTSDSAPTWMPEKTEEERQAIIANLRSVELKWAKRCLFALICFLIIGAIAGIAAWTILRN